MGQSSSNRRRRHQNTTDPPTPPPPPPLPTYTYYPPHHNPNYYPAPPPPNYNRDPIDHGITTLMRVFDTLMGRVAYAPHQYPPQYHYGPNPYYPAPSSAAPAVTGAQQQRMPQFVEQTEAKTVKNDVNVHKDSIRLEVDELSPDQHLVSFVFDALVDGSMTIYYFAKEGERCSFSPVYDMYAPTKVPFQKGAGQKFCQPSGSGIDLGFFDFDDLAKPLNGEIFPLVIYAESSPVIQESAKPVGQSAVPTNAQITLAVIQKNNAGTFQVKVIKQILWANGERYELQEIFGIGDAAEADTSDEKIDLGKECVICLSEPINTTVLPCRHMCLCSDCARALSLQSNKCPICRQPVEKLMEIKVNNSDQ